MRKSNKKINWAVIIFLSSLVLGSWFFYSFQYSQIINFDVGAQYVDGWGLHYYSQSIMISRPAHSESDYFPAVILLHGDDTLAYSMSLLKLEFLRNGYIVVTMNIGKYNTGIFLILNKTVNYLLSQTYINPAQIGIVGHSHGANYAVLFSSFRNDAIHGVVAANFGPIQYMFSDYYSYYKNFVVKDKSLPDDYTEFLQKNNTLELPMNLTTPNNMLLINDKYDPKIKTDRYLYLQYYTDGRYSQSNKLYGNFYDGTARELLIENSLLGHVSGIFSPSGIDTAVTWMNKALGVTGQNDNYPYAMYLTIASSILFFSFVISGGFLLEQKYHIMHKLIETYKSYRDDKKRFGKDW